ncbi:MAG: type VI secretion system protein TssA, partial [Geminicoccaceae bacterium]
PGPSTPPPERAPKDDTPMPEPSAAPATAKPMPAPAADDALTREAALARLSEIALFFRRTEPHSPVAYLLERAVKWADLPLDLWLQQVVKDAGVLSSLNETLGVGQDDQ